MSKTQGTVGRLYKVAKTDKNGNVMHDENGEVIKTVRIYFTQDAVIKNGQIAFCDDIEEDYMALERLGKLDGRTAEDILNDIAKKDQENNRETLFRVKLGAPPETRDENSTSKGKL